MHHFTVAELVRGLRSGDYSSSELTQHYLSRIDQHDSALNSYITILAERAIAAAQRADTALRKKDAAPLTGVPIAHKDLFCTAEVRTTCGSRMLDNFISPIDAHVVEQLDRAGVVLLGKTNMDEFAMGSSNENSYYGNVHNPWDEYTVPGGSSGGSAAAVAAGLAPIATGSDTGGSIRQPASLCSVTGMKPTYGRVSRYGMVAFASSLDQGGLIARSAEDCALVLQSMATYDKRDSTAVDYPLPNYMATLTQPLKGKKIGVPQNIYDSRLDPAVADITLAAIDQYRQLGATCMDITLAHNDYAVPTYCVLAMAECSANLARYDGVRYGYQCDNAESVEDLLVRSRSEAFGDEVKRRIMMGTYVLSSGYYDAYYHKAQCMRQVIRDEFVRIFDSVDFIAMPSTPYVSFNLGEKVNDSVQMYLGDTFLVGANLAGLPALSYPAGFATSNRPVGLQLIAPWWHEAQLLNAAHIYQQATDWHRQRPPIAA